MAEYICKQCGKKFNRNGKKIPVYCSIDCKGAAQRELKEITQGITKDWLEKKYTDEGLSTYKIAKIVNRDPKRVYEWLKDYNIPTRTRSEALKKNSWWALGYDSALKGRNLSDETKKKISETRIERKIPGLSGKNNPMYGIKGDKHPNWKGGTTPERQKLYGTELWKEIVKTTFTRDNWVCQRCSRKGTCKNGLHTHHLKAWADYPDNRFDLDNLITLCRKCHNWVHSNKNINKEYIK